MVFFKQFLIIVSIVGCITNTAATPIPDAFVSLIPQGNIAAATNPFQDGDRRLYYQDSTGEINEYSFNGFFGSGHSDTNPIRLIAPAAEVLPGTPISVVWKSNNGGEIHLYFLSRSRVLSEYFFTGTSTTPAGWFGGPSCGSCLTQFGFTVAAGTTELYSSVNTAGNIAVGHVSAGVPGTISEAVQNNAGSWSLNALS